MRMTVLTSLPLFKGGFTSNPYADLPEKNPAKNRRRSRWHFLVSLVASMLALVLFSFIAFHGYVAWTLAHPYVAPLTSNPMLAKGLEYEDVSFPSASGRSTVDGWYIPSASNTDRTVVFSHGYGANREETWVPMYDLANLVHGLQYNVLMFDYGYASATNRLPATGGVEEAQQLLGAVSYAKSQGAEEIVVWGFSMGGGTALQAALVSDDIDAMILDSMFITDADTLYHNLTQIAPVPRYPSLPLIEWMLPLWTGFNMNEIPAKKVRQTNFDIPIFFVHGTQDAKAPVEIAQEISAHQTHILSNEWIVPGGKHELIFQVYPKEYIQRAVVFLSQVHQSVNANSQV